jgi:hypothetical protein
LSRTNKTGFGATVVFFWFDHMIHDVWFKQPSLFKTTKVILHSSLVFNWSPFSPYNLFSLQPFLSLSVLPWKEPSKIL